MSLHKLFSKRREWESAIGRLVLASAFIERTVYSSLMNYRPDLGEAALIRMTHGRRLKLLEGVAAGRDDETKDAAKALVARLRSFSIQRNRVVHNPLSYAFDRNSTDLHKFGAIIDRANPTLRLGLAELEEMAAHGEALNRRLSALLIVLFELSDEDCEVPPT